MADAIVTTTSKKSAGQEYYYAAGKRKTSIARVRIYPNGKGGIVINDKPIEQYISVGTLRSVIVAPLKITGTTKSFDISAKVEGGGFSAQAQALRHGIARALIAYNETLRGTLKKAGFLTRDARIKERKKPGLKRARRAPQFSKR